MSLDIYVSEFLIWVLQVTEWLLVCVCGFVCQEAVGLSLSEFSFISGFVS